MIEQSTISPPLSAFYGCSFEDCNALVSLIPFQVIGLAPAREMGEDCRPDRCQVLKVFGGGTTDRENDKSYYLFDFPTATGNDYRLEQWDHALKIWVDIDALDNTTGTLFDFGVFQDYPKRSGVCMDWDLIHALHGAGIYRLAFTSIFDPAIKVTSLPYQLCLWSCAASDDTVRLDTQFAGNITNILYDIDGSAPDVFDLNTMVWDDSIRLTGRLQEVQLQTNDVTFIKRNNRIITNKSTTVRKFEYLVNKVIKEVLNRIQIYGFNARKIEGFNYNPEDGQLLTGIDLAKDNSNFTYENQRVAFIDIAKATLRARQDVEFESC
jgi:hypothetical protein